MDFCKGHGTQNDFLVLSDDDARIELADERVAALCDRRRGLGADGVLRVARTGTLLAAGVLDPEQARGIDPETWFMDYRNADGSIAEMCGNGVRVFAHYLRATGRETRDEFVVGSRAGARPVVVHAAGAVHGEVTVDMGAVTDLGPSAAFVGGTRLTGIGVDVGNPHLACVVPGLDIAGLRALDLTGQPAFDQGLFPRGVNVEILTALASGGVEMRVHERGVGETRSCGTGTVAAAYAALRHEGRSVGGVEVRVPGGRVQVRVEEATSYLRGPSALLARGEIDDDWWLAAGRVG